MRICMCIHTCMYMQWLSEFLFLLLCERVGVVVYEEILYAYMYVYVYICVYICVCICICMGLRRDPVPVVW
jgi:hypothetical protein